MDYKLVRERFRRCRVADHSRRRPELPFQLLKEILLTSSQILNRFPAHEFRAENSIRFFGIGLCRIAAAQMADGVTQLLNVS